MDAHTEKHATFTLGTGEAVVIPLPIVIKDRAGVTALAESVTELAYAITNGEVAILPDNAGIINLAHVVMAVPGARHRVTDLTTLADDLDARAERLENAAAFMDEGNPQRHVLTTAHELRVMARGIR